MSETVYDAVEDIRARILRTVDQITALDPAMLAADEQAGVGEAVEGLRRTALFDDGPRGAVEVSPDTGRGGTQAPGKPRPGLAPLADWERELLARQWVNEHGDEETRWLVQRLITEAAENTEVVWALADERAEEIARLRRKVAELNDECRVLRATVNSLAAEGARLRMRLRGGTS